MVVKLNQEKPQYVPKLKSYKKYHKTLIGISIIAFIAIFASFIIMLHLPNHQTYTAAEVRELTKFKSDDFPLVRTMKSEAFNDWLHDGSVTKLNEIQRVKPIITKITNGEIPYDQFNDELNKLKKDLGKESNDDNMNEMIQAYYEKRIILLGNKTKDLFNESDMKHTKETLSNADELSKLMKQSITYEFLHSFNTSDKFSKNLKLLSKIDRNISEVKKYNGIIIGFNPKTRTKLTYPNTKWGKDLYSYVDTYNKYVDSALTYDKFQQDYQDLEQKVLKNDKIIKSAVKIPNIDGKTIHKAKQMLNVVGLKLYVAGAVYNPVYLDGSPNNNTGDTNWDNNTSDRIHYVRETSQGYEYAIKGNTISVSVTNAPTKKPKPKKTKKTKNKDSDKDKDKNKEKEDNKNKESSSNTQNEEKPKDKENDKVDNNKDNQ